MPTSFLLATEDQSLLQAWTSQVPKGRPLLTLAQIAAYPTLPPGVSIVVVFDAMLIDQFPPVLERCPLLVVGRPHSEAYEEMKSSEKARHCLSYEASRERLCEFLPLIEEVAERGAVLDLITEKNRRAEGSRPPFAAPAPTPVSGPEMWDFLEGAIENIGSRERLLAEFRRASRHLLRASHTVFFLKEENQFRADRGSSHCPNGDPLIQYLFTHPVVLDGTSWPSPDDPLAEMAVRNRMALWGARLLVPLHDNGHLMGIVACGVRDDGQPYDEADKARAVHLARLLRQFISQHQHYARLDRFYENTLLGDRYLPNTLMLAADEDPPRHVPLAVRALIGKARQLRDTKQLRPSAGQPFRASAGVVVETGGVWAHWEEASAEIDDQAQGQRQDRLELLRDLALTLNHEVGNALVSLSTLRHSKDDAPIPAGMKKTISEDISRIDRLNRDLVHLANFTEFAPGPTDMRELLHGIGERLHIKVDIPPDRVEISVVGELINFALEALTSTIAENQPDQPEKPLALQLRSTGDGEEKTALISIQGSGLELEGILPQAGSQETPNQGRLAVFIAKEVVRLHCGEIHAGPGLAGTEILISIRHW